MGILTDAFSKLFAWGGNILSSLITWIKSFFTGLFQGLFEFLKLLFRPVFILIAFLFYFIYQLGYIVMLIFQIFLGVGKVTISLVKGIFLTLTGFHYAPSSPVSGTWSNIFSNIAANGLPYFQLDIIAYVLMFLIWFGTAFQAFRIISSMRGGGS